MSVSLFRGRMVCELCGFTQDASSRVETGWWYIVGRGYVCPKCMGGSRAYCRRCRKFFHSQYSACPFCGSTEEVQRGEVDKHQIRSALSRLLRASPNESSATLERCVICDRLCERKEAELGKHIAFKDGKRRFFCRECFDVIFDVVTEIQADMESAIHHAYE